MIRRDNETVNQNAETGAFCTRQRPRPRALRQGVPLLGSAGPWYGQGCARHEHEGRGKLACLLTRGELFSRVIFYFLLHLRSFQVRFTVVLHVSMCSFGSVWFLAVFVCVRWFVSVHFCLFTWLLRESFGWLFVLLCLWLTCELSNTVRWTIVVRTRRLPKSLDITIFLRSKFVLICIDHYSMFSRNNIRARYRCQVLVMFFFWQTGVLNPVSLEQYQCLHWSWYTWVLVLFVGLHFLAFLSKPEKNGAVRTVACVIWTEI